MRLKIAGIIAEYNPFHSGHALHVEKTRVMTGCDYVVACMAGHFTQRGEPACMSKWARARMALSCGVDAVFELPTLFAVRTADAFARGGVAILGGIGVDVLSFGCETPDIGLINDMAVLRESEPEGLSVLIRKRLEAGMAHVRARGEAMGEYLGLDADALNLPNMVLACEYATAIHKLFPRLEMCAVLRQGDYHDESISASHASATAIRRAVERGETDQALAAIPAEARRYAAFDRMHAMDDIMLYSLRSMSLEQIAALPDVNEGLENRVYRLCGQYATRQALLEALKCKRYTHARLSRLLTYALLGMDRDAVKAVESPPYARLIGARRDAAPLLKALKERSRLPIITSAVDLEGNRVFELECRATDIWALLHDLPEERISGREYTEPFVRI